MSSATTRWLQRLHRLLSQFFCIRWRYAIRRAVPWVNCLYCIQLVPLPLPANPYCERLPATWLARWRVTWQCDAMVSIHPSLVHHSSTRHLREGPEWSWQYAAYYNSDTPLCHYWRNMLHPFIVPSLTSRVQALVVSNEWLLNEYLSLPSQTLGITRIRQRLFGSVSG